MQLMTQEPLGKNHLNKSSADFFAHLHRGGQWGYWWTNPGKISTWWSIGQATPLPAVQGANLYFGVHPCREIPQFNDKGKPARPEAVRSQIALVSVINTLFSEFDVKHFNSKEQILAYIQNLAFQPTVLIDSGGGYHAYWFLAEPHPIEDESERRRIQALQASWVKFTGGDPGAKDLARVLRIPGTLNYKYDPPRPVAFVWYNAQCLYSLDELRAAIPGELQASETHTPSKHGAKQERRKTNLIVWAAELLERLDPSRCDDYESWVATGMALSELGAAGQEMWKDWSKGSSKYKEGDCEKKWATFKPGDGLSLGSLYHWANQDNPGGSKHSQDSTRPSPSQPASTPADPSTSPNGYWALAAEDPHLIVVEKRETAERLHQIGRSAYALESAQVPEADLPRLRQMRTVYLALTNGKQAQLCDKLGPMTMVNVPDLAPVFTPPDTDVETIPPPGDLRLVVDDLLKESKTWLDELLDRAKKPLPPHEMTETTGLIARMLRQLPNELAPRYYQLAGKRLGMTRRELQSLANQESPGNSFVSLSSIKEGQLCFLGEPLGNFAAWITHELTRDNGLDTPIVEYTLAGQLADGQPLPTVTIPADQFAGMDWVARYWGARPIFFVPRGKTHLLARAIQEISLPTLIQERVFTHTGWREIKGKCGFLSGSGFLTAEGLNESVRVDLGGSDLRHFALPAPPTGKALQDAVKASLGFLDLGPRSITAPLWAAMYASVFTEVRALYTVPWVYGTTQSGKSTITHLVLTHFGVGFITGRQYHPPENWESSLTALEGSMFTIKDAPLIIDDFAPQFASAHDAREMQRNAQKVVRRAGNRTARNRARPDLTQQTYRPPRGLVMVTAELPLPGESTAGRMLFLPIAPGEILPFKGEPPREALDQAQKLAQEGTYALAMSAFLQWMAAHRERAVAKFLDIIEASNRLARREDVQNRLPDYFAILDAAQQMALSAFYEMGVLAANEAADVAYQNGQAILGVVVNQAERIAAESPIRKFFDALDNLLERQKVYLAPKTNKVIYTPPFNADLIGYFDPDDKQIVYLNDDTCLKYVREYWNGLGENFDITKDALRRQISQISELLARRGSKDIPVSTWIASQGCNSRVLAIHAGKVNALYGVTLKNRKTGELLGENDSSDGEEA